MRNILILLLIFFCGNAEATVQVPNYFSHSPVAVCQPSDSNSNCGGSTNVTINTTSPVTGAGSGTTFTLGVDATKLSGTAPSLTAGTVTTNANLTGDVTSIGNATTLSSTYTGWTDDGTNVYNSTTTDNVGIGTTNPVNTLLLVENAGTQDSFRVNDSVRDGTPFVIDSAGNIGVGTTTPARLMDIITTASTATPVVITDNQLTTNNGMAIISSSTNVVNGSQYMLNIQATGTSGSLGGLYVEGRGTSTGTALVRFADSASDTTPFYIDLNGNVGIGTLTPRAVLDVRTQSLVPFAVGSSATDPNGGYMIITSTGNVGISTTTPTSAFQVGNNATGLQVTTSGGLTSAGNVGISTTKPNPTNVQITNGIITTWN